MNEGINLGKKRAILFSLEECIKCTSVKNLIKDRNDILSITFPHDFYDWCEQYVKTAETFNILEDIKITAPILVLLPEYEKIIGQLRIMRWLKNDGKNE